jgi:hypothetical protein
MAKSSETRHVLTIVVVAAVTVLVLHKSGVLSKA